MEKSKLTTIVLSVSLAVFILTASIAIPIIFRGFYYSQIESLNLVEKSGYSEEVIIEAYDEMMDYCTEGGAGAGKVFGTGSLAWSEEGKAHFDDVQSLFDMDFFLMEVSLAVLILFLFTKFLIGRDDKLGSVSSQTGHLSNVAPGSLGAQKTKYLHPERFLGRGPLFWGPIILVVVFGVIGILAAKDFDGFFVKFHHLFFPGKDNWIFDETKDEIIKILPEEVFQNFATKIITILLGSSIVSIIVDFLLGLRKKANSK